MKEKLKIQKFTFGIILGNLEILIFLLKCQPHLSLSVTVHYFSMSCTSATYSHRWFNFGRSNVMFCLRLPQAESKLY